VEFKDSVGILYFFFIHVIIYFHVSHHHHCRDTKLCGTLDMLEGSDAILGDPDRLEKWVQMNLMKFNKTKRNILHMGWGNSKHKYRLGRE